MHLANQVCFTIAGGEEVYNLGQYLISADWLADFTNNGKKKLLEAKELLQTQVDFYQSLAGDNKLKVLIEKQGPFEQKLVEKNQEILDKIII
jgi:cell division inhibitor SulA